MLIDKLNYKLPKDLIALYPKKPRDSSKIVIVDKSFKILEFKNILNKLNPKDALIFNDTKVLPAGLEGEINQRKVSVNLNRLISKKKLIWSAFIKSRRIINEGDIIKFSKNFVAEICKIEINNSSKFYFLFFDLTYKTFIKKLRNNGSPPLPPYIKNKRKIVNSDSKDYQSILAKKNGAVAAPTASLHFTDSLLTKIRKKKIKIINVTLQISAGTFLPINSKNINEHKMHSEFGIITKKSAQEINKIKKNGGKIIAVGTTVLRILESSKNSEGIILPFKGETDIFIKPGWKIDSVDGLITNFHTPKSSLLAIIYSIIGEKRTRQLYKFAIDKKLRFFSYGDACLIWNK
ncbi:MAG: tRNA preQ1(34) S-adenosylmethionine ribosyltransferase-isomerase QueA [Rickettsiales bacterium]|nr:tRNA preQ1(34) S-adenosylmethionine ribosyltransferase-isomerase QueA [Rickettsiales bacterium]|tara:strand:- start:917 stop:1960 length:1044 start_codon:yes stop_codon:yes gene_type:complete